MSDNLRSLRLSNKFNTYQCKHSWVHTYIDEQEQKVLYCDCIVNLYLNVSSVTLFRCLLMFRMKGIESVYVYDGVFQYD